AHAGRHARGALPPGDPGCGAGRGRGHRDAGARSRRRAPRAPGSVDDLPAVLPAGRPRRARREGAVVRIAVVTQPYYPQNGGVSEHVHHTAIELRRLGHEVDVVTSRFPTHRENADGVLRVGRNVLLPHLGALANVNAGLRLSRDMDRIYRRSDYDVVHVHEPLSPTLP